MDNFMITEQPQLSVMENQPRRTRDGYQQKTGNQVHDENLIDAPEAVNMAARKDKHRRVIGQVWTEQGLLDACGFAWEKT